uniref:Uncharacterized protein n=1 Tax=Talaromyces marneffei PM1 TaxID=1077442 RepID=A0A093UMG9_TALMA
MLDRLPGMKEIMMWFLKKKRYVLVTDKSSYSGVVSSRNSESLHVPDQPLISTHRIKVWAYISAAINVLLGCLLTLTLIDLRRLQSPLPPWPSTLYSPAQHIVQYETVLFNRGLNRNDSIFVGPPDDASDAAWEALWEPNLFAQIPNHQAEKIPNNSIPVAKTDTSIVGLDVFHQLHCLNALRKNLRPERYEGRSDKSKIKDVAVGIEHLDHCVESLRQSLICTADLSPVRWEWTAKGYATTTTAHICRNWKMITDWAESHKITHHLDGTPINDK